MLISLLALLILMGMAIWAYCLHLEIVHSRCGNFDDQWLSSLAMTVGALVFGLGMLLITEPYIRLNLVELLLGSRSATVSYLRLFAAIGFMWFANYCVVLWATGSHSTAREQ